MKDQDADAEVTKADDTSSEDDQASDEDSSEDDSEADTASKAFGCQHVFKGQMACRSCTAAMSKADDDSSDDESSDDDDDDSASKSLSARARSNSTLRKGIEVSDFLETLVDGL